MINWNRLFPPLRQRRNINYQDGRRSEQQAFPPLEVSEEQVISNTGPSPKPGFQPGSSFAEQHLKEIKHINRELLMTVNLLLVTVIDTWAFIGYWGSHKFEEGMI